MEEHWRTELAAGNLEARPGGPYSDVSWAYPLSLSAVYVVSAYMVARRLVRVRATNVHVFECMHVHHAAQSLLHGYCAVELLRDAFVRGVRLWGNEPDTSEHGFYCGRLIWLQYHLRQLELLDTAFMVLRRQLPLVHMYLRVLALGGWYVACRFFCGGDAVFAVVVCALGRALVHAQYVFVGLVRNNGAVAQASWLSGVVILQYVLCGVHAAAAYVFGNFPGWAAALHLLAIANGIVLHTDFVSSQPPQYGPPLPIGASAPAGAADDAPRRVTFSFDSCGWLFVYHFGVGAFIQEHLLTGDDELERVGFSGSSGGALVASVLAAGTSCNDVSDFIINERTACCATLFKDLCRVKPLEMFNAVERAVWHFRYDDAYKRMNKRLRILLTRVMLWPPFACGEIIDEYIDTNACIEVLLASCHVPMLAGIRPRRIADAYYYDGLVWPSRLLVPWRGLPSDHVVRVSACGSFMSDITAPMLPFWWALRPPSTDNLHGLYWMGYRDAAKWFAANNATAKWCQCRKRADSDHDELEAERLQAARAVMKVCDFAKAVPEIDPSTGCKVQVLIQRAEAVAERGNRALLFAALGGLTAAIGVVLALDASIWRGVAWAVQAAGTGWA
eukprot:NODE_3051_length_2101_cov_7.493921.p1 GENE.NODE_3051_length_2101_cov_7.493921~~NODE_3051_length_2101_cov_7.493921.p1  ORF type:complete len:634 (+),score=153.62 NODE_3051_length_2101_cov_7.493921:57-1904(+)